MNETYKQIVLEKYTEGPYYGRPKLTAHLRQMGHHVNPKRVYTIQKPEIFNTDQGSQFTSEDFVNGLKKNDIQISMDGKGRCIDNVRIERLWRSVKYEDVFLQQ